MGTKVFACRIGNKFGHDVEDYINSKIPNVTWIRDELDGVRLQLNKMRVMNIYIDLIYPHRGVRYFNGAQDQDATAPQHAIEWKLAPTAFLKDASLTRQEESACGSKMPRSTVQNQCSAKSRPNLSAD